MFSLLVQIGQKLTVAQGFSELRLGATVTSVNIALPSQGESMSLKSLIAVGAVVDDLQSALESATTAAKHDARAAEIATQIERALDAALRLEAQLELPALVRRFDDADMALARAQALAQPMPALSA